MMTATVVVVAVVVVVLRKIDGAVQILAACLVHALLAQCNFVTDFDLQRELALIARCAFVTDLRRELAAIAVNASNCRLFGLALSQRAGWDLKQLTRAI
jgi:hypothetical protein